MATKIATCCYCGARAALVLRGAERHELSCASCGAPLHRLKAVPVRRPVRRISKAQSDPAAKRTRRGAVGYAEGQANRPVRSRKNRRKASPWKRIGDFLEDALDIAEDIFD